MDYFEQETKLTALFKSLPTELRKNRVFNVISITMELSSMYELTLEEMGKIWEELYKIFTGKSNTSSFSEKIKQCLDEEHYDNLRNITDYLLDQVILPIKTALGEHFPLPEVPEEKTEAPAVVAEAAKAPDQPVEETPAVNTTPQQTIPKTTEDPVPETTAPAQEEIPAKKPEVKTTEPDPNIKTYYNPTAAIHAELEIRPETLPEILPEEKKHETPGQTHAEPIVTAPQEKAESEIKIAEKEENVDKPDLQMQKEQEPASPKAPTETETFETKNDDNNTATETEQKIEVKKIPDPKTIIEHNMGQSSAPERKDTQTAQTSDSANHETKKYEKDPYRESV